nr:putative polyprotein [Tanacetum cinerariifolium]
MSTHHMYSLCKKYLGKTVNVKGKQPKKPKEEKNFSNNEVKLLKELLKEKTKQVQQMIRDQAKEYHENKIAMQKKEELWQSKESLLIKDLTDALKIIEQLKTEQIRHEERKDENIRELKIKQGSFLIEGNKFKIPLIYAFDVRDNNGIKMLIRANFLRSMNGGIRIEGDEITIYKKEANFLRSMKEGIRIEGDEITIYKKVTRIKTSNQTKVTEIAELEVSKEEFLEINESIYFNQEGSKAFLEKFKHVIDRLKHQGYIRIEPLKHWKKNGELCKLDIINPDITIEDRPLKHVTPAMEDSFRKHVDSLLKICAIRPSKSQHRTMAMIVNSRTTIDPITGREVKGKERMEHAKNLERMLKVCEDNGLVLSPTKMKIAVSTVDFSRAVIGEGYIKLQPHIIKKIANFKEEELKTKKGLSKKIKEHVQNLQDLEIPPENAYIILEIDGCIEGWGGIVKWKKSKGDPRSSEKIYAYASGKLSTTQSTIDAKINACINTLEKLKIYYLDKQEVTLRTDCQAIISFYNKTNSNKSLRVRWIKFADATTGKGVKINIEHIKGKRNTLADSLSRLVNLCFAECTGEMKQLAAAALYSVEEVLQSSYAFQKNMKITYEEVMKISNHFQESSQRLSSYMKNQEHYTNITSSKPIKPHSE